MKGDGTIIVDSEKSELYDGLNLYEVLRNQGYADAIVSKMQENVENDSDVATLAIGKRDGKTTFFTSVRLNENDWTIVNFTEENTIAEHSQVILHDTVVAGTVLVIISTIACVAVALVIGRFRRRALRGAERYAVLAEFSDTVLFEYSYGDDVLELTPNARSVFSLDSLRREHYLERGIPLVDFHEEDVSLVEEILEHPAPSGEARRATVRACTLTGEYRWFSIKCRYLYEGQEPYAAVGKMVDITQQRALEEQLVRRSQIDGLTKALNKVTAEEKITASLAAHDRGLLFMIDVDDFKQINDRNGHRVGDQVLAAIARALFDVFRCDDPVGRIGGDEFVAFVRDVDEADVVDAKRHALRDHAEAITRDLGVSVSLSIGVARYPHDGANYQELFDAADHAMYREKQERDDK
ncbi:GGDEF domain-containing protein [Gordonibacter urolithinfaciens]